MHRIRKQFDGTGLRKRVIRRAATAAAATIIITNATIAKAMYPTIIVALINSDWIA